MTSSSVHHGRQLVVGALLEGRALLIRQDTRLSYHRLTRHRIPHDEAGFVLMLCSLLPLRPACNKRPSRLAQATCVNNALRDVLRRAVRLTCELERRLTTTMTC